MKFSGKLVDVAKVHKEKPLKICSNNNKKSVDLDTLCNFKKLIFHLEVA